MNDRAQRPPVVRRLRRGHWVAVDAVAAVLLTAAFGLATLRVTGPSPVLVAVAAACLPVAVRRLWPMPVLWGVLASAMVALPAGWGESYLVVAVVLYTVASLEPRQRAAGALAASLAGVALALCLTGGPSPSQTLSAVMFGWLLMGLSWTVGYAVREQRAHAVRMAEQAAARAVADERLRIARDLHDVVAHSMSLITFRAGVADLVAETRPQEAREALRLIETTGRAALAEMRHMLGMLRSDTDTDTDTDSDSGIGIGPVPGPVPDTVTGTVTGTVTSPVPGSAVDSGVGFGRPGPEPVPRLDGLSALCARAGVEVDLNVDLGGGLGPGRDVALPEGVEVTVYRIVQEALTNVVKHAGAARCRVTVSSPEPGVVDVEVVDDGPGLSGASRDTRGHGLTGMAERVMMYGGALSAGPRQEGGFRVHARLAGERGGSR
ncbi:histidine kinase [Streptosporangium sp. NPDC051023]|uniref:sensor histidine kinase n=1 Tax=Streptosporangium sp. NPDC051023 TaxID=3155410 RepID=UPI00344F4708